MRLVLLALLLVGCIEELEPASLVVDARPLAARVEIAADPTRATPFPGEAFDVRFFIAQPGEPRPIGWALAACPAREATTGEAFCIGDPIGLSLQETPVDGAPLVSATVPADPMLDRVLVLGVLCPESSPFFDMEEMTAGCDDPANETLVSVVVRVAADEATANRHPAFPDDAISLEGAPWTTMPADVPEAGCAPGVSVAAGEVTIAFTLPEEARESYARAGETVREEIAISQAATSESFPRLLTLIDDLDPAAEVEWTPEPEAEVPVDGRRVKFFFVARDDRGGVAYTERALCLVP